MLERAGGRRRRGPGWVPNQHGAWAMLASPLLVGVVAGGFAWVHVPLTAAWFGGYFAYFATSLWLKSRRKARYLASVRVYGALTTLLVAVVLAVEPGLARWAVAFAPALVLGLWFAVQRRDRTLASGLVTTAASALMTVVAYDAGPGDDIGLAWQLAAVQLCYFVGTVFYVKSVIRERGNQTFHRLSAGFHLAVAVAMVWLSPWLVCLFGLLTVRAAVVPRLDATPKQVGIGEVVATLAVAVGSLTVLG